MTPAWQGKAIRLWRQRYRTKHMLLAQEAENLNACTRAEREKFNPKDIRSVQELWDGPRKTGETIIKRLEGKRRW